MRASAKSVESELEMIRQITNLSHQGYYPMAALKIVAKYTTVEEAREFLDKLHGRYIGDELHKELYDLVAVLLE